MDEQQIVAAILSDRKAYDRLSGKLDLDSFGEMGRLVVQAALDYYRVDPQSPRVDRAVLASKVRRMFPSEKHVRSVLDYVAALPGEVSVANIVEEYRLLQRHNTGLQLAARLGSGQHDDYTDKLWSEYGDLAVDEEATANERLSYQELAETTGAGAARLVPTRLNEAVAGGVNRGHNIVVFGRPESGKTAFAINLSWGFLRQKLRVLYTGNEEPISDLLKRILSRFSNISVGEIQRSKRALKQAMQIAEDKGYNGLIAKELVTGKIAELEGLVKRYKPDVLVVDQLKNLKTPGQGNRALELDTVAREVRRLGKAYDMVTLSVTQAGESAEQKLVLGMTDIDFSNTGIPGAADLLIGVGVDNAYDISDRRFINISKNKISGKHDRFVLFIDKQHSKFTNQPRRKHEQVPASG
ncbi:MAG: DnaB-like helicase C-terminal domain-containing protein [Planctomycetota bacterium]